MKDAFNVDTPFFRTMARIGDIFLLNLIFVITSIPVITIGTSVTALITIAIKMTTNKEGYIVSGYLKAFKTNFRQATLIHILFGVIGFILFFDLHFWVTLQMGAASLMIIVSVIPVIIYLMVLLYVYVQQAVFDNSIFATIRNALLMAVKNLPVTILLVMVMIAVLIGLCISNVVRVFMLLYGFGLLGYGMAIVYRYLYREYLDEPDAEEEIIQDEMQSEETKDSFNNIKQEGM